MDTYGCYAFGFLYTDRKPECAATLLHNDVLHFYLGRQMAVSAILTDNDPKFCGTPNHSFELYLSLNDIEKRPTKVRTPRTNGFVEHFNRTVLDKFFRIAFRENYYETADAFRGSGCLAAALQH